MSQVAILKKFVPTILFAILFLISLPMKKSYSNPSIPGFHVTLHIHPIQYIVSFVLLTTVIAYFFLNKKQIRTSASILLLHLCLTVPTVLWTIIPFWFLTIDMSNHQQPSTVNWTYLTSAFSLFFIGFGLFGFFCVKSFLTKKDKKGNDSH